MSIFSTRAGVPIRSLLAAASLFTLLLPLPGGALAQSMPGVINTGIVAICGDGVLEGDELCDDGPANGSFVSCCTATCEFVVSTVVCENDDRNNCTGGECDGAGSCLDGDDPGGTTVFLTDRRCEDNDDNACTGVCDAAGACQADPVNNGTLCDDGASCTVSDQCTGGVCVGTAVDANCDDQQSCTDDTCDPANGSANASGCVVTNNDANPCTDMIACTDDVCMAGTCNSTNNDTNCDDMESCTDDTCDPPNGDAASGCVFTNDNTNTCTDLIDCTDDVCLNGACNSTNNDTNCDDMESCTDDTCDPANGNANVAGCVFTPDNNNQCMDPFSCTLDVCRGGTCDSAPDNGACPDLAQCTDSLCVPADPNTDPGTGCIEVDDDDNACDDGDSCTRNDLCMGGQCVSGGPECGDPNSDGATSVTDCLQILNATVLLGPPCPASACDMVAGAAAPSECLVNTTDVLSCLNCVVELPSCRRECPTSVGVNAADPELFASYGFQLDYDPDDIQVCSDSASAECAVTINRVDPVGDDSGGAFIANNAIGSMAATIGLSAQGLRGAPLAQCSFRGTGPDDLTAADFLVADADFVELGGNGLPQAGAATVEICPDCGDGICGANENYSSCQADCPGTLETLEPCSFAKRDLWEVAAKPGDFVQVSIDTVSPVSQFDPVLVLDCPGADAVDADDEFACTYSPFQDACPSAAVTAQQLASCLVTVEPFDESDCADLDIAGYSITVKLDGVETSPSLLDGDIPLTIGCTDAGRTERTCSDSDGDQAGCQASFEQLDNPAYGTACTYAADTGECFACAQDLTQGCTNVCRP
jgi:hypothetical protein